MKKRVVSLLLTLCMVLALVPVGMVTASAASSAETMVSIAKKEVGTSGSPNKYTYWLGAIPGYPSNGYQYWWCAAFVSWVANQAGETAAVGKSANVRGLRQSILNAGGKQVSSPQAGDIVIYYRSADNYYAHVGIMESSSTSIEGNYGNRVCSGINPYKYDDTAGSTVANGRIKVQFYRPNYKNSVPPPTNVQAKLDKSSYTLGDTVTITPSATGATQYSVSIWDGGAFGKGTKVFSKSDFTGSVSYKPTMTGTFSIRLDAKNGSGKTSIDKTFKVTRPEDIFFDAHLYRALYPDLAEAFGTNEDQLYNHWITSGRGEGRVASLLFDAKWYLQQNDDVAQEFGKTNYAGAYIHFIKHGIYEGRAGSPFFCGSFYIDHYSDLKKEYGNNYMQAAWHFLNYGVYEQRMASPYFSVAAYSDKNPDVAKTFSDMKDRCMHYILYVQYGNEKRSALYTVTYDANGGSGAPSMQSKGGNNDPLTLSTQKPTRTGYKFNGWATSRNASQPDYQPGGTYTKNSDLTLYAVWVGDGVKYTVKHYLQDGDSRRLADTDTLTGTTGNTVTPTPREYPGYSTPSKQSATVKADGSTVIEYVYTIKTYSVTLRAGAGIDKVTGGGSYHYGDTVTVNAEVSDGYDWDQWTGSGTSVSGSVAQRYSFTMPEENVTLQAAGKKEVHQHDLTHYPAVESTCANGGNLEYWHCADCGKYFTDGNATRETSLSGVTLKALGHNYVDGECTRCGAADPDYTAPEPDPDYMVPDPDLIPEPGPDPAADPDPVPDPDPDDSEPDWNDEIPTFDISDLTPVQEVHFEKQTLYFQGQFSDVSAGQWFTQNVAEAYELGLMKGVGQDSFDPYGEVTLAQAITMAARIHSIYDKGYEDFDQSGGKWYQVYLDYAYQNGIISWAYYNADVERKATRAQFAEIFASALPVDALGAINTVSDNAIPDVSMSDACAPYVYTLYRAGVLTGGDANGTFSPQTYITRAEAAAIVSRMAESDNRVSFTLQ